MTITALDALKRWTTVVADTGDFNTMRAYAPRDATTNPSLILKAVQKDEYRSLLDEEVAAHRGGTTDEICDRVLVRFGREILAIVPGRVSTEVDARLSFDVEGSVAKARTLIALYEQAGVPRERVLIKVASTWEGIEAARRLEADGIRCNLTLLFSFAQAVACAQAGVTLISPFAGRIYDWYKKRDGVDYAPADDPGVQSVRRIYDYYKKFRIDTEVMGASFRSTGQVLALAGCDLLTISPELLEQLKGADGSKLERALDPARSRDLDLERVQFDEPAFRFAVNEDAMASDKLAEGIRAFVADVRKLEGLVEAARGG